ncbi:hypothetical protein [Bradyrhizobium sp. CCBAU 51765]|uniref:hypothetical protein n=1 Tax=Bradyrhizobium sp. CCBAU 51765 TaxID=1325102 RepID=UPI001FEFDD44|nr:hypothetical protein [Bradyrhizobium sp. CCBAU 51765]
MSNLGLNVIVRNTEARTPKIDLGHVGFDWTASTTLSKLACSGSSHLDVQQQTAMGSPDRSHAPARSRPVILPTLPPEHGKIFNSLYRSPPMASCSRAPASSWGSSSPSPEPSVWVDWHELIEAVAAKTSIPAELDIAIMDVSESRTMEPDIGLH